jgi:LPS export ABC transporter protein LptC
LKQKVIIFLILVAISGLIIFFSQDEKNLVSREVLHYKEKAADVVVRDFDDNNILIQKITAQSITTFDNKDTIVSKPQVVQFGDNSTQIQSDTANILPDGGLEFAGNVTITGDTEQIYNLQTESLLINNTNGEIYSNTKTIYISGDNTLTALGIRIITDENIVQLLGDNTITLSNNNIIKGKNIEIVQKNQQDYIYSSLPAIFESQISKVTTQQGFYMYDEHIFLLGEVDIIQEGIQMQVYDLKIIGDNYQAEQPKYTQENIIVNANNVFFNEKKQIIELSGNVEGVYE